MRKIITIATLIAATLLGSAGIASAHETYPVKGIALPLGSVTECVWNDLRAQGFKGVQGDHREALYVTEQGFWLAMQRCGAEIVD